MRWYSPGSRCRAFHAPAGCVPPALPRTDRVPGACAACAHPKPRRRQLSRTTDAALMERLNAAGIPCKNMAIGSDEIAPVADPLPIDWKPRFGFEVAVPSHDLTAAQQILEKLLAEEPQDLEIPEQPRAETKELPRSEEHTS